jgi:hypothetical protein
VGKRLEITLFGTLYSVGLLHMNRGMIKAGMKAYGPTKWNRLVNEIAFDSHSRTRVNEVSHTIGQTIKIVYQKIGISMQGHGFGMEVFYGGEFFPVDMVEAKNRTLQPNDLTEDYKVQDILGVFWAKREGAMFYRWDDVEDLSQEDVVLTYEGLGPVLASKRPFDLAIDIKWQGRSGYRSGMDSKEKCKGPKHVFHVVK